MEQYISFSELDDFIFCPASLYFHVFYKDSEDTTYKSTDQILGTAAHEALDERRYSNRKDMLQAISVYSENYRLGGKIDLFDCKAGQLIERKRQIRQIFDGYVYQLYGQYFALREMGYEVRSLSLYSVVDHKSYPVPLPSENEEWFAKFEKLLVNIRNFSLTDFRQENVLKCQRCIYRAACSYAVGDD